MPVSDHADYDNGHFKRVYDHIIKPACIKAGFEPLRADDVQKSNIIVVDILHKIVNCEMALCDLSSKNPNVLYELGIRQAFDLPVALIKDNLTPRIFDIQGFRDVGYDSTMRIDQVNSAIENIAEAITATYEQHDTKDNSIISLLSITKANISEPVKLSPEMSLMMETLKSINDKILKLEPLLDLQTKHVNPEGHVPTKEKPFPFESNTDSFENEGHLFKLSDIIYHKKFGKGVVTGIQTQHGTHKVEVDFDSAGIKVLLSSFVKFGHRPFA